MLTQVGTDKYDYVEMAQRMEAKTGGISCSASVMNDIHTLDRANVWVRLKGKALDRNAEPLCGIMAELCTCADFSDIERLATVIGQVKSSMENSIPSSGHSFAAQAGAAALTPAASRRELWGGLAQLQHIKQLAALPKDELKHTAEMLTRLQQQLFERSNMRAAITAEEDQLHHASNALASFITALPQGKARTTPILEGLTPRSVQLGWATSIPVSYVTRCFRTIPYAHRDAAALNVLATLLRANFLHREIREKGGAYGGMASNSSDGGIFCLLSYRDPHLERTLDVYKRALEWVEEGTFGAQEIKEAILSVFSSHDRPKSPSGRAATEFANKLQEVSYPMRQQFRENLLRVSREDLIRVAHTYLSHTEMPEAISIISSEEKLRNSAQELPELQINRI
jgi:hypothetical protein